MTTESVATCVSLHGVHGAIKLQCDGAGPDKDNTARRVVFMLVDV